jgi:hypothetical protein
MSRVRLLLFTGHGILKNEKSVGNGWETCCINKLDVSPVCVYACWLIITN